LLACHYQRTTVIYTTGRQSMIAQQLSDIFLLLRGSARATGKCDVSHSSDPVAMTHTSFNFSPSPISMCLQPIL